MIEKKRSVGLSTTNVVLIGDPHIGHTHHIASLLDAMGNNRLGMPNIDELMKAVDMHDKLEDEGFSQKTMDKLLKDLPPMVIKPTPIMEYRDYYYRWADLDYNRIEPKRFDMATGKMVDDKPSRDMSEQKRSQLRKKRKKRKKKRR